MKKLMTMIAAVATAFGLYATDVEKYAVGFEAGDNQFTEGILNIGDGTGWSCTDGSKLTEGAYDGDAYDLTRNPAFAAAQNLKFLNVKTALTDGLQRTVDHTVGDDAFYFDQLVKFTAADEPMAVTGAKIALYVQDLSEADSPKAETNLYVVAGQYVDNVLGANPVVYNLGAIDINEWHRLTIKTFKAYNNDTVLAFEIFVDGNAMSIQDAGLVAYDAASAQNLNVTAQALNFAKKLFPSIDETSTTIDTIELAGQGGLDDFIATTALPGEFARDLNITLSWDSHVTALKYTAHGQEVTVTDLSKPAIIPWAPDMTIVVDPTFAQNWDFDQFAGSGFNATGYELSSITETADPTITSKDVTPRVSVTIDGDTQTYPTIAKAIAAINTANKAATISLSEDMTLENKLDFSLTTEGAVELDLNGHTITGVAGAGQLAVVMSAGALTIKDSVGTGAVIPAQGEKNAVLTTGKLMVTGGQFDGVVTAATSEISGGKFLKGEENVFPLTPKTGFKAELAGTTPDYWVVSEKQQATISLTYDSSKVAVTGAVDGQKVYVGETITIAATAATGYQDEVVTINDATRTTYTVVDADVAGGVTITVAVTATVFDITYMDDETELTALAGTYTIENRDQVTLAEGPKKDGYNFDAWYWDAGCQTKAAAADFAEKTGDQVLYAKYDAKTYTIEVTGGEADTEEYTIADVTDEALPVELTAEDKSEEGLVFKNWTVTTPDEGFEIADANAAETTLTISVGTLANFVIVANFESAQTDPIPPLPDDPSEDDVNNAIDKASFVDTTVKAMIGGDPEKYNAFKAWAGQIGQEDVVKSSFAAASYQVSPIVAEATLFTDTPTVTFTKVEANGDSWDATLKLTEGATGEEVQLLVEEAAAAYAKVIRVGTVVDTIEDTPTITATEADAEDGKQVKLTIEKPGETAGFIKFLAE